LFQYYGVNQICGQEEEGYNSVYVLSSLILAYIKHISSGVQGLGGPRPVKINFGPLILYKVGGQSGMSKIRFVCIKIREIHTVSI